MAAQTLLHSDVFLTDLPALGSGQSGVYNWKFHRGKNWLVQPGEGSDRPSVAVGCS